MSADTAPATAADHTNDASLAGARPGSPSTA